jgi:hypothetical protein
MKLPFFIRLIIMTSFVGVVFSTQVLLATPVFAVDVDKTEERLRAELEQLEKEQALVEKSLNTQKAKSATIERDVNILSDQIYSAELSIRQKNIEISKLKDVIALKQNTVAELTQKMNQSKAIIAQLIRHRNELNNTSLAEVLLSNDNLTDFFVDLDSNTKLKQQLDDLYKQVAEIRGETEEEKAELALQQNKELDLRQEIVGQKEVIEVKKTQQDQLLAASRDVEATYETVLAAKRQEAARIRAALFQLRDADGIPFGEALKYAQSASQATGVRAAFILAILTQESDLGKNVGTCNLEGQPDSKKWFSIMPGPNDNSWRDDQTIYKRIVKNLGLDVDSMPLSCPWQGGWGGAMGPSQFIPVTWDSYASRIASAVGVNTANPWNPEHAIMATALYVKDLGAAAGGYTAERTAALKYYAGSNWSLPQNAFYGNSVVNHAAGIQKQIDFLDEVD